MAQKKKGKKVIAKVTKAKKRKTQYGTHVSIKGKVKRKKNPEQYVVVIDKGLTKQYVNVVQRGKVGVVHDKRDAMMFKSKRGAENVANALKEIGLVARAIPAAELPNVDSGPGFHAMEGGGVVASGARATSIFRILALKSALKLETHGLKMTRGTSAAQIIRDEFGWKTRDKKKLLAQLEEWIATHLKPEEERQKMSMMGNLPVQTREDNPRPEYQVIVSNVGSLVSTYDRREAMDYFNSAKEEVSQPRGRSSGETVTLMYGGEIIKEYTNDFQSRRQGTREDNPNRNTATGAKSTRWEDLWAVRNNVATPAQIINAWKADGRGALRGAVGDAIMERIERDERSMYGRRSWRETKREAINYLIEGHGVELLGLHKRSGELAYYVNSGDTYATTIIFIGGRLTVGTWGDMIESGTVREVGNDELLGYRD